MKIIGLLIVLAIGLLLVYFVAGDYMVAATGGGSEEMKFEPMKMTREVTEKLGGAQSNIREKIEKATSEGKEENK